MSPISLAQTGLRSGKLAAHSAGSAGELFDYRVFRRWISELQPVTHQDERRPDLTLRQAGSPLSRQTSWR